MKIQTQIKRDEIENKQDNSSIQTRTNTKSKIQEKLQYDSIESKQDNSSSVQAVTSTNNQSEIQTQLQRDYIVNRHNSSSVQMVTDTSNQNTSQPQIQRDEAADNTENKQDSSPIQTETNNQSAIQTQLPQLDKIDNKQDGANSQSSPCAADIKKQNAVKYFEKEYHNLNNSLEAAVCDYQYTAALNNAKETYSAAKGLVPLQSRYALKASAKNTQKAVEEYYETIARAKSELVEILKSDIDAFTPDIFDKMTFSEIEEHTEKIKQLMSGISDVKENADKAVEQLNTVSDQINTSINKSNTSKSKGKTGNTGKSFNTAVKTVSRIAAASGKIQSISSDTDSTADVAEGTKDVAAAAAKKAIDISSKTVDKGVGAISNIAEKTVNKIKSSKTVQERVLQNSQKKIIKTAEKKAVKTSAKAVSSSAKNTAKAAKTSAKAAKKAAKEFVEVLKKTVSAIKAVITSPVGLIAICVVILLVIIFNVISGAAQIPSAAASAIGSSLSWLFGDTVTSASDPTEPIEVDELTLLYIQNKEKVLSELERVRTFYKTAVIGFDYGDRDTLVFNGSSFYPASSASEYAISQINDIVKYSDYPYFMQLCYIWKLREERVAQSLDADSLPPEITLSEDDFYNFFITYCFSLESSVEGNQYCPTNNCQIYTWFHPVQAINECNNKDENGSCLGHNTYFCNRSHKKITITFFKIGNDVIEETLDLTDKEKTLIQIGTVFLEDLDDAAQTTSAAP